jgi:hypothetical protein
MAELDMLAAGGSMDNLQLSKTPRHARCHAILEETALATRAQ